jgi:type I restriction enzyme R subunit
MLEDTHKRITEFFTRSQMFGFTGTPIFADNAARNALGKRTTKDLFGECLHRYVITNAIRDENVLRFSIEYWGKLRRRDGTLIDDQVTSIDTQEFFENSERIGNIVDWIIQNHGRKTHNKDFTAILAVSSIREQIVTALRVKPKILERKAIIERVTRRLMEIVHTFDEGIGGLSH